MFSATTIYGFVELMVPMEGLEDLRALQCHAPRLRVEVRRGEHRFVIPLQSLLLPLHKISGNGSERMSFKHLLHMAIA